MFLCLTWMGYVFTRQLKETILAQQHLQHAMLKSSTFRCWKKTYIQLCDYFHQIDSSFGCAMLIFITSFTVKLINDCFYLILLLIQKKPSISFNEWLYLIDYIKIVAYLLILLCVPTWIEQEVNMSNINTCHCDMNYPSPKASAILTAV